MNAINIKTELCAAGLVGKSHWWGAPDLPTNIPYPYVMVSDDDGTYPEPLTFICQINLEELAVVNTANLLPHKGMLYFFAAISHFLGEESPIIVPFHGNSGNLVKVIYVPDETDVQPYEMTWEGTDESVFRKAEKISFELGAASGYGNKLLSVPYHYEVRDAYPDKIALLQIEENDDWNLHFFDCGTMYLLITAEDLCNLDFNNLDCEIFTY